MSSALRRTLAGRLLPGLLLPGLLLVGAAGCGGTGEANAAGLAQGDLVSALAAQLSAGSALSYTATYQLAGGETATITRAQRPPRTAYVYPGGRLLVTTTATISCKGDNCTQSAPDPTAAAGLTALVTPEAALGMLNTAALDPAVEAAQHDTTVAGRHATCLDLQNVDGTPARDFTVCVTNEGALASFAATLNGTPTDLAMTAYSDRVSGADFTLPASAKITTEPTK